MLKEWKTGPLIFSATKECGRSPDFELLERTGESQRVTLAVPAEAETDGLQPRRTDGQAALQVLRGLSEVSLAVERAQRDTTETFAPGFAEPPAASRKTADGGAAALWKTLRTVSETQIAQSPPAAASTPHAPPAGNGGENWPELLERDARRYDGGYDFI